MIHYNQEGHKSLALGEVATQNITMATIVIQSRAIKGSSFWELSLIGYFFDKKMSFPYINTWAQGTWGDDLDKVFSLNDGFFVFKITSQRNNCVNNWATPLLWRKVSYS